MKRLLQTLTRFTVGILATRFLVVAIAAAAVLGFGLRLAGHAVLVAEYSMDQAALRFERLVASIIVVANLGFLFVAVALWRKTKGVKSRCSRATRRGASQWSPWKTRLIHFTAFLCPASPEPAYLASDTCCRL